jgi:ParB family chromosome partitioning protein
MNELTTTEDRRLGELESTIEYGLKTFVEVGTALAEIRDSRLYRREFRTFEEYCRERWQLSDRQALRLMKSAKTIGILSSNPTNWSSLPERESQARPLTSLEPEQQIAAWETAVAISSNGKPTAKQVQQVVDEIKKPIVHVSQNSGNNEWYTPPQYIEAARRLMGDIDTDPASSETANKIIKAKTFYTEEDDGLAHDWNGRVWLNPPYAQPLITEFCEKFSIDYRQGFITEACVLVNNATETKWFNFLMDEAAAICFIRGRVKFLDMDGNPTGTPLQGQAVLYFGKNTEGFTSCFSQFGRVLYVAG